MPPSPTTRPHATTVPSCTTTQEYSALARPVARPSSVISPHPAVWRSPRYSSTVGVRSTSSNPPPRARNYDWERRTEQLSRRAKAVPGPQEDRERIVAFLDSRAGVEAYVEPRTV